MNQRSSPEFLEAMHILRCVYISLNQRGSLSTWRPMLIDVGIPNKVYCHRNLLCKLLKKQIDCFNQVVVTMVANNLKNEAHYFAGFYLGFEFEGEIPTSNAWVHGRDQLV